MDPAPIDAEILAQVARRGPAASICPSEVARALSADWRPLLGPVRLRAAVLAGQGRIEILRKGKVVSPAEMKGVIRLRLAPDLAPPPGTDGSDFA